MARTDRVAPTGLSSKGIVRLRLFNRSLTNTMSSFGARVGREEILTRDRRAVQAGRRHTRAWIEAHGLICKKFTPDASSNIAGSRRNHESGEKRNAL